MAVKVLRKGKDPKIVKEVSCNNCAAYLEYVPNDVDHYERHYYDGSSDTIYYIVCPECDHKVEVKRRY